MTIYLINNIVREFMLWGLELAIFGALIFLILTFMQVTKSGGRP